MRRVTVEAYAKVNLGLAVGKAREDGFHEIETVFQSVSLADTVEIERADQAGPGVTLRVSGLPAPPGQDNLAFAAAEAARDELGAPPVAVGLHKRIPIAAGLGGGSADAAAVLKGVDALFDLRTPLEHLKDMAARLGSDVPFMLQGGTAHGTGRGELTEGLPPLSGVWFVLATPDFGVSAAEAYRTARIGLTGPRSFIRVNCSAIREGDIPALIEGLRNDLEAGVVLARPEVAVVKHALLEAGASAAVMSGSGPTVLGVVRGEEEGRSTASRLAGRGWNINVVAPVGAGQHITSE